MKAFSQERWDRGFEARLFRSHVGCDSTSPLADITSYLL